VGLVKGFFFALTNLREFKLVIGLLLRLITTEYPLTV
jgi:hypothetical protein